MQRWWIKVYRSSTENELYFAEPFTRRQARQDLLLLTNHSDWKIIVRWNIIEIKRWQCWYSETTLSERWKWSRNNVRRFLKHLETIQQIVQQKSKVKSVIVVINYEKYQWNDTTDDTTERHQKVQQKDTNKNDKNNKKWKDTAIVHQKTDIQNTMGADRCKEHKHQLASLWYMIMLWYEIENSSKAIKWFIDWMMEKADVYWYRTESWWYAYWEMRSKFDRRYEYHKENWTSIKTYRTSVLQFLDPNKKIKWKQRK